MSSTESARVYEVQLYSHTPGQRAMDVRLFKPGGPYTKKFLLPCSAVEVISERVQQVGQVRMCEILAVRIPDRLAISKGLDPENDALPEPQE